MMIRLSFHLGILWLVYELVSHVISLKMNRYRDRSPDGATPGFSHVKLSYCTVTICLSAVEWPFLQRRTDYPMG